MEVTDEMAALAREVYYSKETDNLDIHEAMKVALEAVFDSMEKDEPSIVKWARTPDGAQSKHDNEIWTKYTGAQNASPFISPEAGNSNLGMSPSSDNSTQPVEGNGFMTEAKMFYPFKVSAKPEIAQPEPDDIFNSFPLELPIMPEPVLMPQFQHAEPDDEGWISGLHDSKCPIDEDTLIEAVLVGSWGWQPIGKCKKVKGKAGAFTWHSGTDLGHSVAEYRIIKEEPKEICKCKNLKPGKHAAIETFTNGKMNCLYCGEEVVFPKKEDIPTLVEYRAIHQRENEYAGYYPFEKLTSEYLTKYMMRKE